MVSCGCERGAAVRGLSRVECVLQVIPILRAGLVLLEQAGTVLPASQTFHVGYVRDEATLQVSLLYGRQHGYYSY